MNGHTIWLRKDRYGLSVRYVNANWTMRDGDMDPVKQAEAKIQGSTISQHSNKVERRAPRLNFQALASSRVQVIA